MAHPTHKVLQATDAVRPFTLDMFEIVEFNDRVPRNMEVVKEGSREECVEFVRKSAPPPHKKIAKK